MKPKAIIFDLDGTLCTLSDSSNPYNHDGEEVIIPEMRFILQSFHSPFLDKILLTGRKKKEYWYITEKWLEDNGMAFDFDRIIMQEKSQADKNHVFKEEKLRELQKQYDIIAVFDDNPDLVPVCKKLWILLLQVHFGG